MTHENENENWEGPNEEQETEEAPEQVDGQGRAVATVPPERKAQLAARDGGYIKPTTIEETVRLAKYVIYGNLAPDSYKTAGNPDEGKIVLGLMAAMEAGLPPLYGLRQIAIINGRPSIWGDGAIALVQSKNLIANQGIVKIGTPPTSANLADWPDDYGFEVKIWRRNQTSPYVGTFTVGHAKRAKLWMNARKIPWMEHPERMLFNRARAFALRDGFADALGGIAIREELEDTFEVEDRHVEIDLSDSPKVEAPEMPETEEEVA